MQALRVPPLTPAPPLRPQTPFLFLSEWTLEYDRKTGHFYHFNTRTGESEWVEEEEEEDGKEEEEGVETDSGQGRTVGEGKERRGREREEVVGSERAYPLGFTGKNMQRKRRREERREGKRKEDTERDVKVEHGFQ